MTPFPSKAAIAAALILLLRQSLATTAPADPATDLVRTRLFLTTDAPAIDLAVDGASLANAVFTLRSGPESVREVIDHNTIHVTRNPERAPLDLEIDTILAGIVPGASVGWTLASEREAHTRLEVWNVTRYGATRVDQFNTEAESPGAPTATTVGTTIASGRVRSTCGPTGSS